MTGYVSTRFYRAPEIMLSWKAYGASVDIWSAGCIISELCTGNVLFPGIDHVHHVNLIFELLGTPTDTVIDKICAPKTKEYLMLLPKAEGLDFRTIYGPHVPEEAVDLLKRMLVLDPGARITAKEALQHAFFESYRMLGLNKGEACGAIDHNAFDDLDLGQLKSIMDVDFYI